MFYFIKAVGIAGLVLTICGVTTANVKKRDLLFMCGGAALLIYSVYLGDIVFIALEAVYIVVTGYHRYTQHSFFERVYKLFA